MNKLLQRSYNAWKRPLALLMAFLMIFACLPIGGYVYADGSSSVSVTIRAQAYGGYMAGFGSAVSVSSDLAESYGYKDSVSGGVSALDALVKSHEIIFGEEFTKETADAYLAVNDYGYVTTLFGVTTSANGFLVNGGMPNDGILGEYGYTGKTVSTADIKTGDVVDFFIYQDDAYYSDAYSFVDVPSAVTAGNEFEVTVKSTMIMAGFSCIDPAAFKAASRATEYAGLGWLNPATGAVTPIEDAETNESGKAKITAPVSAGTYYLVAMSAEDLDPAIIMNPASVTVKALPTKITVTASAENMVGTKVYAKKGDTFTVTAKDEKGNDISGDVIWSTTAKAADAVIDKDTGVVTIKKDLASGGTFSVSCKATHKYNASLYKSQSVSVNGYDFSSTYKTKTQALSEDGAATSVSLVGGVSNYNLWTYEIPEGIAALNGTLGKTTNIKFDVFRPGTFTVTATVDLGTKPVITATVNVTGVGVETSDGTRTKTTLDITNETPAPQVQLKAFAAEGRTISSWTSSDESIAVVDGEGLVTAKGLGTAVITATDSKGSKGGIKVTVSDPGRALFESIEILTTGVPDWKYGSTFKPETFEYDVNLKASTTSTLALQNTTLYNTEKFEAFADYTDVNGDAQHIAVKNAGVTSLTNMPFGKSVVRITITDKTNSENTNTYIFNVTRPRDNAAAAANTTGIVFTPAGRELSSTKYNGSAEGTMFQASAEGVETETTGVKSDYYNYRCYALDGLKKFKLTLTGSSKWVHFRYSSDNGSTWKELPLGTAPTDEIAFGSAEEAKVIIQAIGDADYCANTDAGKGGFESGTINVYTVWVTQIGKLADEANILEFTSTTGDQYPETIKEGVSDYLWMIPNGAAAPTVTYKVSKGATVKLGGESGVVQTPIAEDTYSLTLTTAKQAIYVSGESVSNTYNVKYAAKSAKAVPDKIVDFLCINGQYTNGLGSGTYGIEHPLILSGTLRSLGNFGGYATFFYEDGVKDDPKNKYGMDFYVYGNANKDTSTDTHHGFYEPGQVWVSENGTNWYALAGSEHYEADTDWNYTVTYTKTAEGKTAWTDNHGNSNDGSSRAGQWPLSSYYYLNDQVGKETIVLSGVMLTAADGTVTGNGTSDAHAAKWGYVDVHPNGTIGADVNPYVDNSDYNLQANGFDLKWAVDAEGMPVDVSGKEFHYIKVQTASNIWDTGINEKSTEVQSVIKTTPQSSAVGTTAPITAITISDGEKTSKVNIVEGTMVYEASVGDAKYVSVGVEGAAASDNIYVNNNRIAADGSADSIKVTSDADTLVRVLVQNGDKEPQIYIVKLSGTADGSADIIKAVKVASSTAETKDGETYTYTVSSRTADVVIDVETEGEYTITDAEPNANGRYDVAEGENVFTITATLGDGATQTVKLIITKEASEPVSGTITVSFTLLGDDIHEEGEAVHTLADKNLKTWISKTSVTVPKNSVVMDVFAEVLLSNGYTWVNADGVNGTSGNYISSITNPSGVKLEQFTNGSLSGWMYTLNGKHSDKGVIQQTLNNGDVIVFHYTDDYTKESGSEKWTSGGNAGTAKSDVIVEPNAKINGNTASANVTEKQIADAITEANKAKADEIIIAPKETGKAAQIDVTMPAAAAAKVAGDAKAILTVDTVSGDVSIPADALASIAGQAGKRDITISIEAKPVEKIAVKDAGENAVAVNVTITAGEEKITSFGGKSITIDIPVTNSYKSGEKYLVLEISDNGSQKVLTGKCSGAADSRVVSVSASGLSDFVVTTISAELPFTDVAENAYYRSAVAWALDKGITSGTSKTTFSPDASCTRAQMATFLWVAAGKPEPASASCSFTDVKPGDYFYKPVLWMVENGLTSGVSKTAFGSNAPCTRAQMAVFLYKFNKVDTMEIKDNPFSDVKEGAYYYDAVLWAAKNGITSGTGKGTFSPDAVCTRAQMVTFLFNYLVK
ncbi:MAG: S-layer homology domain-containing protein [Clostridia bacterium]|nr:S-layer homology domain-containing protein [Clostridia bacterium]